MYRPHAITVVVVVCRAALRCTPDAAACAVDHLCQLSSLGSGWLYTLEAIENNVSVDCSRTSVIDLWRPLSAPAFIEM